MMLWGREGKKIRCQPIEVPLVDSLVSFVPVENQYSFYVPDPEDSLIEVKFFESA